MLLKTSKNRSRAQVLVTVNLTLNEKYVEVYTKIEQMWSDTC